MKKDLPNNVRKLVGCGSVRAALRSTASILTWGADCSAGSSRIVKGAVVAHVSQVEGCGSASATTKSSGPVATSDMDIGPFFSSRDTTTEVVYLTVQRQTNPNNALQPPHFCIEG